MNAVEREIYRHLFASVAEEMGVALMRSSFSPNIKERRDFSCAVFDARAEMVAQAAHIPVHLGSAPLSVRAAIDAFDELGRDDHVVLNDPYAGGTHLPDITVVSPVWLGGDIRLYVANRAHHADVGGATPGSLPLSRSIDDEGIRIGPTLWSRQLEDEIAEASRTGDERRGDLRAQLAANRRGIERLQVQWERRGAALMEAAEELQDYSEALMRSRISEMPTGTWEFSDVLDGDGFGSGPLEIHCRLSIDEGSIQADFTQTVDQTDGPVNVPRAVTVSAVLYVLRCLAPKSLPSNGGYMRCANIVTREGSLVDARPPAPVAIGNVETSQRITDVVLGAFAQAMPDAVPAASCGSMNNVTIGGADARDGGGKSFAYYETLAGGAGAGFGFDGASAVHTHMTNTLNTPVEALEHAYPFRVTRYAIRGGSGGDGMHRGGDGVVREYEFDAPATVTLMTERRRHHPWGLRGGEGGALGRNYLIREGEQRDLPAKGSVEIQPGDRIVIETPGGGGYGADESDA
ncbi:MAG: hydantoinase B/oxoprolinase family protein [Myxococcota bacterium]